MSERVSKYHLPGMARLPSPSERAPRGGSRPYRRGSQAERELLADLRHAGQIAFRSAGSQGPYDLYALAPGGGTAYQVKCYRAEPPAWLIRKWWHALPDLPAGWRKALAVKVVGKGWAIYDDAPAAA